MSFAMATTTPTPKKKTVIFTIMRAVFVVVVKTNLLSLSRVDLFRSRRDAIFFFLSLMSHQSHSECYLAINFATMKMKHFLRAGVTLSNLSIDLQLFDFFETCLMSKLLLKDYKTIQQFLKTTKRNACCQNAKCVQSTRCANTLNKPTIGSVGYLRAKKNPLFAVSNLGTQIQIRFPWSEGRCTREGEKKSARTVWRYQGGLCECQPCLSRARSALESGVIFAIFRHRGGHGGNVVKANSDKF
uniref:(northern house mosquito) hypothetical protein n=1 Tax=Culex pipiens TaxID=7175 RepID=A0A8D8B9M1_CULPI